jgi:MFS superfamily sulfate permease-like transporter
VSIGLLISIYYTVLNNFKDDFKITTSRLQGIDTQIIKLNSNVTFLNKVKLRKALDDVPEFSVLIIDGEDSNFIDFDILEIISEFENKAHNRHIELHLKGIKTVHLISTNS